MNKILSEVDPKIINAHYVSSYGTILRKTKTKRVTVLNMGSDIYHFPLRSVLHKILKKNLTSTKLISTSKIMADEVSKYTSRKDEIGIVPFGIDTSIYKPQLQKIDSNLKEKSIIKIGLAKILSDTYT